MRTSPISKVRSSSERSCGGSGRTTSPRRMTRCGNNPPWLRILAAWCSDVVSMVSSSRVGARIDRGRRRLAKQVMLACIDLVGQAHLGLDSFQKTITAPALAKVHPGHPHAFGEPIARVDWQGWPRLAFPDLCAAQPKPAMPPATHNARLMSERPYGACCKGDFVRSGSKTAIRTLLPRSQIPVCSAPVSGHAVDR